MVGVLSIVPCCPFTFLSFVVNVIALIKSTRENRWKPLVALIITLVMGLMQLFFTLYSIFSKPS